MTESPTTLPMTTEVGDDAARKRASFHTLTVSGVRRLTADAVEVTFTVPPALAPQYDYVPGQYVALRATIDGREVRRSYSLCAEPATSADGSARIAVGIKRDLGGRFSVWANTELAPGMSLDVMSPQGSFVSQHGVSGPALTEVNDAHAIGEQASHAGRASYVGVAAGSGITPVIAIAKAVLRRNQQAAFDLVYANRAAQDVMFLDELADLKDRYPARLALHHVLSREQRISPLLTGRIDAEKLTTIIDSVLRAPHVDEWFLCGPFELVQLARDTLAARGVPTSKIRFELFTTGRPDEEPAGDAGRPVVEDPEGENYAIEFNLDGLHGTVASPKSARETILNAALRVRGDVPFACAGGVCGTCRAKVVSGTVDMDENYALEADEVERGYVLTCQSRPTSDAVSVDYDA